MKKCNEIQQLIAEFEFNPIEDKAILQHIETCQKCQEYQHVVNEMNQTMLEMNDFDADDGLVESTLSSIVNLQEEAKESNKPKRLLNTQWASALAASFMLVSLIVLFPYNSTSNYGISSVSSLKQNDRIDQQKLEEPSINDTQLSAAKKPKTVEEEKWAIAKRKEALQRKKAPKASDFEFYDIGLSEEIIQKQRRVIKKSAVPSSVRLNHKGVGQVLVAPKISREEVSENFDLYKKEDQDAQSLIGNEVGESVSEYADEQDKVVKRTKQKDVDVHLTIDEIKKSGHPPELNINPVVSSVQQTSALIGVKPVEDNIDPKILDNYTDASAHRYSKISSQDDEGELDKVTVTGSRIKASDLEEASPVTSTSRDESVVFTEKFSKTSSGKLNETTEKLNLEIGNRGIEGNLDGKIGQKQSGESKPETVGTLNFPTRKNAALVQGLVDKIEPINDSPVDSPVFEAEEQVRSIAPLTLAQQYLSGMSSLQDLNFQSASGYWANTYLPGDSSMRLLEASLANNKTTELNNSINQNIQPFDYPVNSALAVYLNSDVANVQSQTPTRMRVQVGIQASNRQGGQRAAMNVGLVFDMSNKTTEYTASMKALLLALLKSKQPGDNISLTVAGAAGGRLIEPKDFRHGQIQVVMNNLFADEQQSTKSLNLNQAIRLASEKLQNDDDPTATLGSSVIMLFSANEINDLAAIESLVHANALKGITMSTVSLGLDNHQQLKQLALAGQGHARILQSSNDAKRVIDEELLASSRAVARALRLRIRLAKGVKLIEVIDSYNLNKKQSQRVRDAELSLDKRLSKNLGIKTDRGEDEEGIQIVIPSFFAGDTHVVLLDVVANHTNAIADVTLRYKDLLYLRNAISRKQLNLENNPKVLGPLHYNVMKNALASKFSESIKQASIQIRQGNHAQSLTLLVEMKKLYQSLRAKFPVWNKDQEILNDEKLLQEYITILNSLSINDVQKINYIVDSLQYISWRKHITQTQ